MNCDLEAEFREALAALERAHFCELTKHYGIPPKPIEDLLVGIARINRIPDTDLYEPAPSGVLAYITPVRVEEPASPESSDPWWYVRNGEIVDLVAWNPRRPSRWALLTGLGDWLGCVPPQYFDPEPVQVWRSVLSWFRVGCRGLVPLSRDPAIAYSLLMGFPGGIYCEDDDVHAAQLERMLEHPWPRPNISVAPTLATEVADAVE